MTGHRLIRRALEKLGLCVAAALVAACGRGEVEVSIVLVSDYVGGVDVGCIQTTFPSDDSVVERCFDEPTALTSELVGRHQLRPSTDARKLELALTTPRGEPLHDQTWVTIVDRRMTVVVSLSSACRSVQCPEGSVCQGQGRCVPDRCVSPTAGPECGEACASASDCAAIEVADCAEMACVEGSCVPRVREGACDERSYCDYDFGCAPWRATPSIHEGVGSTCVLHGDGRFACVGNNSTAIFGDGSRTSSDEPVWSLADDMVSVGCGPRHCCGVHVGGRASCWGTNYLGQMGNGRAGAVYYTSPQRLPLRDLVEVAAGESYSSYALVGSTLYRWGGAVLVEDGEQTKSNDPVRVEGLPPVRSFSGTHSPCALTIDGEVWCWGRVVGESELVETPRRIGLDPARWLIGGDGPRCAALESEAIVCWGATADLDATPRPLEAPPTRVDDALLCGSDLCVRGDGAIHCRALQLAPTPWREIPLPAEGGFGCLAGRVCALETSGELACWDGDAVSRRAMRPSP
ncbi:MAG: hypothetical protein KF901_17875 [Myxococcales bacterium]|nr:hypothetical protein [Myxococcales bacterium]